MKVGDGNTELWVAIISDWSSHTNMVQEWQEHAPILILQKYAGLGAFQRDKLKKNARKQEMAEKLRHLGLEKVF